MLSFVNKVLIFLTKPDRFSTKSEISGPIVNPSHPNRTMQPPNDSINPALLGSAIFRNDLSTVQTLLNSGTNPNTPHRANTPLMWAAGEGYNDICVALLDAGAETDTLNAANYTALMYAAESDRREIVELLLDRNSTIEGRNAYQETVLMTIAKHGHTDLIQRLLSLGANPHDQNHIHDTAFYLAVDNGHLYSAKVLHTAGSNVNARNLGDWTPLMMAAARGDLPMLEFLLSQGADFTPRNKWGATALDEAKKSFRSSAAMALLRAAGATE